MKTAILISGHMRSFERCLPTLHWHVFRHFPGADFYVSTEPDMDSRKAHLLRSKYPDAKVSIDTTPQPDVIAECGVGIADLEQAAAFAPYAISVPIEAVLGQLWRLQRCWDFCNEKCHVLSDIPPYDAIIRCRPDLWMESARIPNWEYLRIAARKRVASDYTGPCELPIDIKKLALTPWWGRFGGVNDRFALLGMEAARHYFTTFSRISPLIAAGCPLHPESLIKASLRHGGCVIDDTLDISFSTLRANGERRFPEIMAQDIAHFRS